MKFGDTEFILMGFRRRTKKGLDMLKRLNKAKKAIVTLLSTALLAGAIFAIAAIAASYSITATAEKTTLEIGESTSISVTESNKSYARVEYGTSVSFTSSDSSVVTVNSNGIVTAVGNGTATVTVTATHSYASSWLISSSATSETDYATITFTVGTQYEYYYASGSEYVLGGSGSSTDSEDEVVEAGKSYNGNTYSVIYQTESNGVLKVYYADYTEYISVDKYLTSSVADENGYYYLNFDINASKFPSISNGTSGNIVLVIDTSFSMAQTLTDTTNGGNATLAAYDESRWAAMYDAVESLLTKVFATGNNYSVTLVTFNSDTTIQGTYTDKNSVLSVLNSIYNEDICNKTIAAKGSKAGIEDTQAYGSKLSSGTHTGAALYTTNSYITNNDISDATVILLTDGMANDKVSGYSNGGYAAYTGNILSKNENVSCIYTVGIFAETLFNSNETTIEQALGADLDGDRSYTGGYATTGKWVTSAEQLEDIFGNFAAKIISLDTVKAAIVYDEISEYFAYVSSDDEEVTCDGLSVTIGLDGLSEGTTAYTFAIKQDALVSGAAYTNDGVSFVVTTTDDEEIEIPVNGEPVAYLLHSLADDEEAVNQYDTLEASAVENDTLGVVEDTPEGYDAYFTYELLTEVDGLTFNEDGTYTYVAETADDVTFDYAVVLHVTDSNGNEYTHEETATVTITVTPVYTVIFKDYDGEVISEEKYVENATVTVPADPTREADETYTYEFAGWTPEVDETATGDAEYTATYEETFIDYTVTFVDYDGDVISTNTYHYGDTVDVPADPTREADKSYTYEFAGWTPEVAEEVTEGATYVATYEATAIMYSYEIHYVVKYSDGEEVEIEEEAVYDYAEYETLITAEKKTIQDATLVAGQELTFAISDNEDENVLYVYYTVNQQKYTVYYYVVNTTTSVSPCKEAYADCGTIVEEYPVSVEGYTALDDYEELEVESGKENVIIFYYDANVYGYEVNYILVDVDGTETVDENSYTSESAYKDVVEATAIEIEGYTLDAERSESVQTLEISYDTSLNVINFYYNINTYTVTWYDEDGITVLETDENVPYGTTTSFDAEEPEKDADFVNTYEFAGWTPEVAEEVTEDATYVATYEATPIEYTYTVNYYIAGTTTSLYPSSSDVAYYGDEVTEYYVSISGYGVDEASKTITIAADNNEINFYYTANTYSISYIYEGYVPEDATELPATVYASFGDTVTLAADATANGYTFSGWTITATAVAEKVAYKALTDATMTLTEIVEPDENGQFTVPAADVVIIGSFAINAYDYEIDYVVLDENGEVVETLDVVEGTADYKTEVTAEDKTFEGYEKVSEEDTLVIDTQDNVLLVVYEVIEVEYTVYYYIDDTETEVSESVTKVVDYGTEVTEEAPLVEGFTVVSEDTQTLTVYPDEENVIIFYYTANDYYYTVNFYLEGTEEKIADSVAEAATYGSEVTVEPTEFEGYTLVDGQTAVTIVIDVEGNEINFYYTEDEIIIDEPENPEVTEETTTEEETTEEVITIEEAEDPATGDTPVVFFVFGVILAMGAGIAAKIRFAKAE